MRWRRRGPVEENYGIIATTLALYGGRVDLTAKALGIARSTIYHTYARIERQPAGVSDMSDTTGSYRTRKR